MEAQEQERAWIARELHDDLGQRMVSLTVQLDRLWQEDASDRPARISDLGRELTELAKDTQAISHRLHSSKLEYLGLATAAKSFCRELSAQRGVLIEFTHEDLPSDLPHDIALGLFRVLQEALSNAVKHSRAQHFEVWLQGEGDAVQLEVADDGVGFDPEAAMDGHGLGLISMRERISLIRGEFFIESHPDSGTTIRARVRVRRNSPPAGTDATTTIVQESE
jgi:signal transduction histidine kinase